MNDPAKVTDQTALLFTALFCLTEARESLGRDRLRAHVTCGLITSLLCAYAAVPNLIYAVATGEVLSSDLSISLLLAAVAALALCKVLFLKAGERPAEIHPFVKSIVDAGEEPPAEEEIAPDGSAEEEPTGAQDAPAEEAAAPESEAESETEA